MKTLGKLALFVISFAVSAWAAYHWWLKDWTLVWMLMVSILLHEAGHWFFLSVYGMKPGMFFIPLLGAAVSAPGMAKLDHKQAAYVALAGPGVNFVLFMAGLVWFLNGEPDGLRLASLNANLAWFNLIPLFIFDGQRFAKAIFASLDENGDKTFAGIVSVIAVIVGFILIFAGKAGFFYILIYYGIFKESRNDNPSDAWSDKAMSNNMAKAFGAFYIIMLFSTMAAAAFLPFWNG